jgi:hypothetical protein
VLDRGSRRQCISEVGVLLKPIRELARPDVLDERARLRRWRKIQLCRESLRKLLVGLGGATAISTYGSYSFTPNLSAELWVTQMLGRFSDGTAASLGLVHLLYPEKRASPFFTLGAGTINVSPKATIRSRSCSAAHAPRSASSGACSRTIPNTSMRK